MKNVKNWFYLAVGIIGVFSAATHIIDGLTTELPILSNSNLEYMTKSIFAFNYNIVAADHLGLGIALIIMAFHKNVTLAKGVAWAIIIINTLRVIVSVITVITAMNISGNPGTFWIPAIANTICIALLLLGTKVKEKSTLVTLIALFC